MRVKTLIVCDGACEKCVMERISDKDAGIKQQRNNG